MTVLQSRGAELFDSRLNRELGVVLLYRAARGVRVSLQSCRARVNRELRVLLYGARGVKVSAELQGCSLYRELYYHRGWLCAVSILGATRE